ncbi:hypothetical protein AUQ39_12025 [Lacticaseibacillus casei]|nr:hypothetical protein [Lacticaseibacillus zeae]OLS05650.1 hypothetical protein AUQ39_12025 [Lacticaseibacillus casei]QVI32487.1 hypothetical protein KG087_02275 [Lacticaseibacillus zeae]TLF42337.1 hypothetical protein FEI14_05435 [Lacticaseibacillus zeae]
MNNDDVFQKRYKRGLSFFVYWNTVYLLLGALGFTDKPLILNIIVQVIIPLFIMGYLIYEYFKLKVKRPAKLSLLIFAVLGLLLALLMFLKIVKL